MELHNYLLFIVAVVVRTSSGSSCCLQRNSGS